jgi:glycosyltransferase involved in cell wall biosynthesis
MRVVFLIGSLRPGGSERQLIDLLGRLDRARFEPSLYAVYRDGELLDQVPSDVPVFSYWDRHAFPRLNFPGRILFSQGRNLAGVLRGCDARLICDRNLEMTLLAAFACRSRPTPRVSIIDCDPIADLAGEPRKLMLLKRPLLRRAYRNADRVVTVSEGVRSSFERYYGLPPDNVATIANFTDVSRVDRLAAESHPPMSGDRFHLVSVGRLQPQKGLACMLGALDELVHRRGLAKLLWWVLGQGPLEGDLQQQVRRHRLEENVRFEGHQLNPYPYLKHAHLFCLPSLYEGMPTVLAEAMACGVPVLAADCPSGPREMLDGGRYGRLVAPGDATALADAVADAVVNYPSWRSRTPAARAHVEACYSAESGAAKYEALFSEIGAAR